MGFQLNNGQRVSIKYHSIFNFPLRKEEVKTWEVGKKYAKRGDKEKIQEKNNFVFVKGKEKTISIRQQNEKISEEKLTLALAAAADIARIPTVLLVALTGSLAMKNATKDSDIDMMIVTQENTVWTTRLAVYVLLKLKNWKIRTPGNKNEKDKLCLNMWMDESSLAIHEQNIYSAHEVVQIVPLINKNKIYEKFLWTNKWVREYWPNVIQIVKPNERKEKYKVFVPKILENSLFLLQKNHMKKRQTREVVERNRAWFHPRDWQNEVQKNLKFSP